MQFAAKNGITVLDENYLNSYLSLQRFYLIYAGTQRDAKGGSGVAEFDSADLDHAIRFTATGTTKVARVEFELVKHGVGADMAVEVRSGYNPDGSTEGVLLKRMVLPMEFIPASRSYWSIPIALEGLTSGAQYWLIVRGAGDATNHFHLHGETSQDANYPCYYRTRGGSGAWTLENAIHFRVFSGESGDLLHGIYGNGVTWVEYSDEVVSKVYRYLSPPDSAAGGIRNIQTYTWSGEFLTKGEVS